MEWKKKKRLVLETKARLIGIGGIGHGVGGSHLSILMLNYLAGYERRRSALLEWNSSGTLEKLEHVCTGKISQKKPYRILDADYYKSVGSKELTEILTGNYDDILIDFGSLEELPVEFLRCERQFLVGSFSEWQQECFREFVRNNGIGKKSWKYLAVFGSEESRKEFMRRPGVFVERIPFSADAFSVTEEVGQFFENLL